MADAPALGAGGQPWGFKSLHPHFIDNRKMVSENARKDLQTFGRSCIDRSRFHKRIRWKEVLKLVSIKEADKSCFELYDMVSMKVHVQSEYKVKRIDHGLGGFLFEETPVEPYVKDLSVYQRASDYEKQFDITSWRFYMAFDGEKPVGAMTVTGRTKGMNMLYGREDACVLWDIRVSDDYKHRGIGQKLLDMGISGAKADGYRQMIIECQNNNVPACKFYKKQGAFLSKVDMYAYYLDADIKDEIQMVWYLDI